MLNDCYDELGNRYQIPMYVLVKPANMARRHTSRAKRAHTNSMALGSNGDAKQDDQIDETNEEDGENDSITSSSESDNAALSRSNKNKKGKISYIIINKKVSCFTSLVKLGN